jgi:hypothetical protein
MPLDIAALGGALARAVLARAISDAGKPMIKRKLDAAAFEAAVSRALVSTFHEHGSALNRYDINSGFFEHEGADEIARLLLAGPAPDGRRLARSAVESVGLKATPENVTPLVAPFDYLLKSLRTEISREERLRTKFTQAAATRDEAADLDEREFLEWTVRRFEYLQTAGIGTSQHLQMRLEEVFVNPAAVRENRAGLKWTTAAETQRALLDERLRNGEISHEEYESRIDRLGLDAVLEPEIPDSLAALEVIRKTARVVVLGDPGTGKTTLLRYLAIRHSSLLLSGETAPTVELGEPRIPLYIRAGDFARSPQRDGGLSGFIAPFIVGKLQCPIDETRLARFVTVALRSGRCLLLIDGLDEVSSAAQRAVVVQAIADFVTAQHPRGNRFVCTSRISGYAAAPLSSDFAALRLVEMSDDSIARFLSLYVPAIERAEARAKDQSVVEIDATSTVNAVLNALEASPGVRRLASNPLLLTALLLVQRTHGALPERRVDAYKAVADALGHTWRAKQGVPEAELPDERRLTRWLTRLAQWMHEHRPEGSAALRDLLEQWGPLLAQLQREEWDANVLEVADIAATPQGVAVLEFVEQIERHSGLLVERAPQRWGFPHLTFEEYYTGRALAFEGNSTERPANIRARLHDARYDEPILLALGLIGKEQPEQLEELFELALLASGPDAERHGFRPSELEHLLGRDFRFALRALADDIPASPAVVDMLLARAIDELLHQSGAAQFERYRRAVQERLTALQSVSAGARANQLLNEVSDREMCMPDVFPRLVAIAAALGPSEAFIHRMQSAVRDFDDADVVGGALEVLWNSGRWDADLVPALRRRAHSEDPKLFQPAIRMIATQLSAEEFEGAFLPTLGAGTRSAAYAESIASSDVAEIRRFQRRRRRQGGLVGQLGRMTVGSTSVEDLFARVRDSADAFGRAAISTYSPPQLEGEEQESGPAADDIRKADELVRLLRRNDLTPDQWESTVQALISPRLDLDALRSVASPIGQSFPAQVADRLIELALNYPWIADRVGQVCRASGWRFHSDALDRLVATVESSPSDEQVVSAATVVVELASLSDKGASSVADALAGGDPWVAYRAATALARQRWMTEDVAERLADWLYTNTWALREISVANSPLAFISEVLDVLEGSGDAVERAMGTLRGVPLPVPLLKKLVDSVAQGSTSFRVLDASRVLEAQPDLPSKIRDQLAELILWSDRELVAVAAAQALSGDKRLGNHLIDRIVDIGTRTKRADILLRAAEVLQQNGALPDSMRSSVLRLAATTTNAQTVVGTTRVLVAAGPVADGLIGRLAAVIKDEPRSFAAERALRIIESLDSLPDVAARLLLQLADSTAPENTRVAALRVVGRLGPAGLVCDEIVRHVADDKEAIRRATERALVRIGTREPCVRDRVVAAMVNVVADPAMRTTARDGERSAQEGAYNVLWQLHDQRPRP